MKPAISGIKGAKFRCIEKERQALLKFKQELEDDHGVLSSWASEDEKGDCCQWRGVRCSNRTGHVTLLDLNGWTSMPPGGKISDSLLELQHLNYLDMSTNDFFGSPFPYFIGSLNRLRYLNLSYTSISGTLSYQFGNLSRLQSLDVGSNSGISFENLDWLSRLSFLEHLHLSWANLRQASDWLQVVTEFPHLKDLELSDCSLSNTIPLSLSFINSFKSLAVLDLSYNDLAFSTFNWLSNFSNHLVDLNLANNWDISPENLEWFPHLSSLENLDLSGNNVTSVTDWPLVVNKLPGLQDLQLSGCSLSNTIPPSLSFINSSNSLTVLDLSFNDLAFSTFNWLSNFSNDLVDLDLRDNWDISPENLEWLPHLSSSEHLDLSGNRLTSVTDWLLVVQKLPRLQDLQLSFCSLSNIAPPSLSLTNSSKSLAFFALSHNNLTSSVFPFALQL